MDASENRDVSARGAADRRLLAVKSYGGARASIGCYMALRASACKQWIPESSTFSGGNLWHPAALQTVPDPKPSDREPMDVHRCPLTNLSSRPDYASPAAAAPGQIQGFRRTLPRSPTNNACAAMNLTPSRGSTGPPASCPPFPSMKPEHRRLDCVATWPADGERSLSRRR